MKTYRIASLGGDGVGVEVVAQAENVLAAVGALHGLSFEFERAPIGGAAIDATGVPLPESTLRLARAADAVLLGAVGGPKWESLEYSIRPERALLGLRSELGLYANLRPAYVYPCLVDASTLKREVVEGVDLLVVRELTGDVYFGKPRGVSRGPDGIEVGINTMIYSRPEIERIVRMAFEIARKRRRSVASVDKANVLECTELWRTVATEVHKDYPDCRLVHMYVDNAAMQLIRNPRQFDVMVTTNLFGDILSDEAAMLTGSIGMLPSASLGGRIGLYEPVHGSAPDIAGQDKANPVATVLSAAMMLRYSFSEETAAQAVESAVRAVLESGERTADLAVMGGSAPIGCRAMGAAIVRQLRHSAE